MQRKSTQNFIEYDPNCKGAYGCPVRLNLVPYWFLAALRIVLTLLPQIGYIHPDEYFQSLEVVAGDILDVEVARPWEFNTTFPIRSVALPYITVGFPLAILKSVSPLLDFWFGINILTPYTIVILPRLVSCLLSFVADYCLYRICYCYGQNYRARLITFASSYVVLVYGTRTFSNMTEMVLTSILLCLVADCMCYSDRVIMQDDFLSDKYDKAASPVERVKLFKMRNALPSHSLTHCLAVASVTVIGIFNRPTFIAFAFPPIFFWLHRGLGSKNIGFGHFHLRILTFVLAALPAVVLFILIDSFYYGYLTKAEIGHLEVSLNNFVVTPLNFLRYNSNSQNLAQHGLHPRYLHFLVNLPLLYNVLGILSLLAFLRMVYKGVHKQWSDLPRIQSIIGLMTASFILPVGVLSMFPHQEARFLIPVTVPIIFLHSQRIRHSSTTERWTERGKSAKVFFMRSSNGNIMLTLWYLFNIVLTVFYGFLHQGGVYPLMDHFNQEMQTKPRLMTIHVVTSHTYSLPLSLLQLENSKHSVFDRQTGHRYKLAKQFFAYEMGSRPLLEVQKKLEELLESCEFKLRNKKLDYRLYLALPASLSDDFHITIYNSSSKFYHTVSRVFYPHISTEALPKLSGQTECSEDITEGYCEKETFYNSPLKYLTRFIEQFGLVLIRISAPRALKYSQY
ncbi:GPI mannosyltransferase 4 [Gryllus bimaculatus]|nr:GPI mannosyltransferase 4 [Gryllus bimaculatus]